jgi:hypothetical protein
MKRKRHLSYEGKDMMFVKSLFNQKKSRGIVANEIQSPEMEHDTATPKFELLEELPIEILEYILSFRVQESWSISSNMQTMGRKNFRFLFMEEPLCKQMGNSCGIYCARY